MKVGIVMGSTGDFEVVKPAIKILKSFGIETETRVLSAHRTTDEALSFTKSALDNGFKVIIAAAGKAAHLPGVLASVTPLPVIGLPVQTSIMGGIDSLFSIVQMPKGVPVLTVGVNAAENAALSALRILSLMDEDILAQYEAYVQDMKKDVERQDQDVQNLAKEV